MTNYPYYTGMKKVVASNPHIQDNFIYFTNEMEIKSLLEKHSQE
ncbi:MAG: hypothetical protein NZZ41_07235 [Candidatus Dojkabacteria bacterium]|nr:hypothetical protein [Candidatus Dojkabacteria bacterium]